MPEGDTVWLAARRLDDALAGETIRRSDFRVPQLATSDLTGARVAEVASRGKHLLTRLQPLAAAVPLTLHTHFRMDGTWHLYRRGARWSGGPAWQARVVLETDSWQAVGYRLPVVELFPTADEPQHLGHLGPDLLGADWDCAEALRRLRQRPRRGIGPALLDQRNLAGIGNLYKTEVLFLCGLTPWTAVADVPDLAAVVERVRALLQANKDRWQQSTTGSLRRGEDHWVFERAGRPCRRCGTPVAAATQTEPEQPTQGRICYWCPRCQPRPAPGGAGARRPAPRGYRRYVP